MSLLVPETGVGGRRPAKDTSAPTFHRPEATASRATIAPCDTPTKAIRTSATLFPSSIADGLIKSLSHGLDASGL